MNINSEELASMVADAYMSGYRSAMNVITAVATDRSGDDRDIKQIKESIKAHSIFKKNDVPQNPTS